MNKLDLASGNAFTNHAKVLVSVSGEAAVGSDTKKVKDAAVAAQFVAQAHSIVSDIAKHIDPETKSHMSPLAIQENLNRMYDEWRTGTIKYAVENITREGLTKRDKEAAGRNVVNTYCPPLNLITWLIDVKTKRDTAGKFVRAENDGIDVILNALSPKSKVKNVTDRIAVMQDVKDKYVDSRKTGVDYYESEGGLLYRAEYIQSLTAPEQQLLKIVFTKPDDRTACQRMHNGKLAKKLREQKALLSKQSKATANALAVLDADQSAEHQEIKAFHSSTK